MGREGQPGHPGMQGLKGSKVLCEEGLSSCNRRGQKVTFTCSLEIQIAAVC